MCAARSDAHRGDRAAILAIGLLWLLTAIFWIRPGLVLPDGAGYAVHLASSWIDGDLLYFDEWAELGMIDGGWIRHKEITRTDHLGNHWAVGSAMAWLPAFAVADAVRPLFPPVPRNGFSLPYNVAIVVTSAIAGLIALLAGYHVARSSSTPLSAALAACGVWVGTPLMWYALAHASMAHAISAMASALVFAVSLKLRERAETQAVLVAGLAVGFAVAVRPQNGVLALVPLFVAGIPPRKWFAYATGFLIAALPQLVVSVVLYGSSFGFLSGGGTATPFASFERIWWWEPLFSWYHGLFTWTPFAAIGICGLFVLMRRDARLAVAGLYLFTAQWAINAALERSFWGATSFGQRRFDSCVVVVLIGAAALFDVLPRVLRVLLVAIPSAWTLALFVAAWTAALDLTRYHPPADLVARIGEGFQRAGRMLAPIASTPSTHKTTVALLMLISAAAVILAAVLILRVGHRVVAVYFLVVTLLLVFCGLRDQSRVERYRALIDRNRPARDLPGGADVRFGLLADEADYLRRSGRRAEAKVTERELETLRRQRDEALQRLR